MEFSRLEWVAISFSRESSPGLPHCRQFLYHLSHLISVLTIWWYLCRVVSGYWKRVLWPACSFDKTLLAFAVFHFVLLTPNLPVILGISWFPTFASLCPIMKRTYFFGVSSRRSCRFSYSWSTSASLDTFWPGGLIFWCHIFLPFHTVHEVLVARILEWVAISAGVQPRQDPQSGKRCREPTHETLPLKRP